MRSKAGILDRRVRLERRHETTDAAGQVVIGYQPIATVFARLEPLGGREGFGQEQFVAVGDVRFTIRWRADVNPLHRIVYAGVEHDVVSCAEQGRQEFILVVAKSRPEIRKP